MRCRYQIATKNGLVPCRQCMVCRVDKRRVWTARAMLESLVHEHISFLTLTYSDEFLPEGGTLVRKDFVDFVKRLREKVRVDFSRQLRVLGVGEYGDNYGRPHYHAILYGYPTCVFGTSRYSKFVKDCCEVCDLVRDEWGAGFIQLKPFIRERAQYVSHYTTKAMTRKDDERLCGRAPEFPYHPRRPGLGGPALTLVADVIREHGFRARDEYLDVPGALKSAGGSLVLGRFLREKLREELGDEDSWAIKSARSDIARLRALQELASFVEAGGRFEEFFDRKHAVEKQAELNLQARLKINQSRRQL